MKIEFLPEADEEFREAARYYESEAAVVGIAFVAAVHRAASEVAQAPLAAPVIRSDIHRKVMRNFPYSLFYAVETDAVVIVSVAHQRRRPNFWHARFPVQKDRS